jgi:hypothetical protein
MLRYTSSISQASMSELSAPGPRITSGATWVRPIGTEHLGHGNPAPKARASTPSLLPPRMTPHVWTGGTCLCVSSFFPHQPVQPDQMEGPKDAWARCSHGHCTTESSAVAGGTHKDA